MATTIRDDAPYKEFAERLRKFREEAGLTRAQLGEKTGVSGRAIINYENGERIPFGDTCAKMAEVFHISADELLGVANTEADLLKAKAIDDMGRIFGKKSADSAQEYLNGTHALLAGGTLTAEEEADFIDVMKKVLFDAEVRAKQKYTPKKFRTPEWEERTEAMRKAADDVIREADENMRLRAEAHGAQGDGSEDEDEGWQ